MVLALAEPYTSAAEVVEDSMKTAEGGNVTP